MKPGDIVLIHQLRYVGTFLTWNYWSHAFIYVGNNLFIDSNGPRGVGYSTLTSFNKATDFDNYAVLRVKGNPDIPKVIAFVEDKIGYPYDYASLFRARKQINASKGEFGYGYTCTELIWAAYLSEANINLDNNGRGWITTWEIYCNKNVEILYVQHPEDVVLRGFQLIYTILTSYI